MLWWQNMEKSSRTELEASSLVAGFHNTNRCCVGPWGEKLSMSYPALNPASSSTNLLCKEGMLTGTITA